MFRDVVKLGIIGYPLEHSFSPKMQNTALHYLSIGGEYTKHETKEEDLEATLKELINDRYKGFNVTIPYKSKIIPLLNKITDTAKLAGAVNTVIIDEDGNTTGDNTDIYGFWEAIPESYKEKIKERPVSLLGYGGAAKAACIALLQNGAKEIVIYGRNQEKAKNFLNFLNEKKGSLKSKTVISVHPTEDINLETSIMLINTTPIGMYPNNDETPITDLKALESSAKDILVYDLIYNPVETKLLTDSKALNRETLNGIGMLVHQGALALSTWLNLPEPPTGAMKLSVEQILEVRISS